jgi:hypothetical protein
MTKLAGKVALVTGGTPAGLITRPEQGYATRSHWWSNQELCSKPGAGEA